MLTQPVHSSFDDETSLWVTEFERIQQKLREEKTAAEGWDDGEDPLPMKQYVEASHVKMLEAAGARPVPVDFTLEEEELEALLEQLNGLYIPGDAASLITPHQEYDYTKRVREILRWAQRHNEAAEKHFPVLGVGYGMQAMVKSQTADDFYMAEVPQGENLQINLAHAPEHTYLFDEYVERELAKAEQESTEVSKEYVSKSRLSIAEHMKNLNFQDDGSSSPELQRGESAVSSGPRKSLFADFLGAKRGSSLVGTKPVPRARTRDF